MNGFCVITRREAIDFLSAIRPSKLKELWNGSGWERGIKRKISRHARGPGSAAGLLELGLKRDNGNLVMVARIGLAPYQNRPAEAAVGRDLAPHTLYLSRFAAVDVTHDDVVEFLSTCILSLRDLISQNNHNRLKKGKAPLDCRYLLSLDDPMATIIEHTGLGVLTETNPATGRIYVEAGALDAGPTKSPRQPTRWVNEDGQIKSIYQSGRNLLPELRKAGVQLISEGEKRRFVWVLAAPGTLEYSAWRRILPANVKEPIWGDSGLGWVQPRLLIRSGLAGVPA